MENRCITCGEIIPEGRQVCGMCMLDSDIKKRVHIERDLLYFRYDGECVDDGEFSEEIRAVN